jgi:phenylacetic acid degradation operon negative regulatory protein
MGDMHARSAVFDVYGDLLSDRAHQSTVAGLVRLLTPVGITAPAVRTAVSRMVSQGWLTPVRLPSGRGYRATDRAVQRFSNALERAYRPAARDWDGSWHLALTSAPAGRTERARLSREMTYLGFAPLHDNTWVSPFARSELTDVLARNGATALQVRTSDVSPADAPLSAWDLDALAEAYRAWHAEAADRVALHLSAHADPDEAAFAARFHQWRKFLFTDPGLPPELLPANWPGTAAAEYFAQMADELSPRATAFVNRVLSAP